MKKEILRILYGILLNKDVIYNEVEDVIYEIK